MKITIKNTLTFLINFVFVFALVLSYITIAHGLNGTYDQDFLSSNLNLLLCAAVALPLSFAMDSTDKKRA